MRNGERFLFCTHQDKMEPTVRFVPLLPTLRQRNTCRRSSSVSLCSTASPRGKPWALPRQCKKILLYLTKRPRSRGPNGVTTTAGVRNELAAGPADPPADDCAGEIPSRPNGVTMTASVRNALSAGTAGRRLHEINLQTL